MIPKSAKNYIFFSKKKKRLINLKNNFIDAMGALHKLKVWFSCNVPTVQ